MKKFTLTLLVVLLAISMLGTQAERVGAQHLPANQVFNLSNPQQVVPTAAPGFEAEPSVTPAPRVLPPVGGNVGLVVGAAVLVFIIISGVIITSRWRGKH